MRIGTQVEKGKFLKTSFDKDALTRHGVILGSTGSGKTGLGIRLLEELAMDGVPIIAIDPKGDLGNLLDVPLMPTMIASDYQERTEDDRDREIQREIKVRAKLKQVDMSIYTPGHKGYGGGKKLGIYGCSKESRSEFLKQVLSLAYGYEINSLSIPYVFLEGEVADLESNRIHQVEVHVDDLIQLAVHPRQQFIKSLPLDDYISSSQRMELARKLTSLSASTDFQRWAEGELNIEELIWSKYRNRCKLSIISIAHLPEADRKFFLPIFLSELISTMRKWQGTDKLRAVLYIDECAGMVPSVSTPPTKNYLMTLLKQARAYGLGVILATQNPADLDYKALGNVGSWWVGRLQTDRDRAKVREAIRGSDGAVARLADTFWRGGNEGGVNLGELLGGLEARQFVQSINGGDPIVVKSNDCLCRLSGPMTLSQIGERMEWRRWSYVAYKRGRSEGETYRKMLVAGSHCALRSLWEELRDLKYWRDMKLGEGEGVIGLANFLWRESIKPILKKRLRSVQDDLMQRYLESARKSLIKEKVG